MKLIYLIISFIVLSITSLFIGVQNISVLDIFQLTEEQAHVLFVSRFPRLVSIILAGVGMSVCGLIMQQLTRNKFVSPTTAGTEDSARFGILVSMMLFSGANQFVRVLVAFFFALLGSFIFMKLLDRVKYKDAIFIPLVGMMFGSIVDRLRHFLLTRKI